MLIHGRPTAPADWVLTTGVRREAVADSVQFLEVAMLASAESPGTLGVVGMVCRPARGGTCMRALCRSYGQNGGLTGFIINRGYCEEGHLQVMHRRDYTISSPDRINHTSLRTPCLLMIEPVLLCRCICPPSSLEYVISIHVQASAPADYFCDCGVTLLDRPCLIQFSITLNIRASGTVHGKDTCLRLFRVSLLSSPPLRSTGLPHCTAIRGPGAIPYDRFIQGEIGGCFNFSLYRRTAVLRQSLEGDAGLNTADGLCY